LSFRASMLKKFPNILKVVNNEKLILKKLKKAVNYSYRSKFYKQKLDEAGVKPEKIKTIQDFKEMIPLTTRDELIRSDPYETLAIQPGNKCLIYSQTSGSTGGHVPLWVTKDELERSVDMAVCLPVFQDLMSSKDRVALCYPYTRTLAGRTADLINQKAGVTIIPMGSRNNMYPPEIVVETLTKLKPTILGAAATDAFSYANIMLERGVDPKSLGIRLIISGAEPCADNRAEVLGRLYNAKVLSLLGQNEVGMAIPCEHNVLHLPSFVMFTEVYRDDGTEVEPGEMGNSVVTPTWREAQPILRYDTGDVIKVNDKPCKCGLPLPTIEILGRKRTGLEMGGKKLFPIELEDILYRSNIHGPWYQMTVGKDSMKVVVEHPVLSEYNSLKDEIATNLSKELSLEIDVEVKEPGTLYDFRNVRPGKPLSRVVDDRSGKGIVIEGA